MKMNDEESAIKRMGVELSSPQQMPADAKVVAHREVGEYSPPLGRQGDPQRQLARRIHPRDVLAVECDPPLPGVHEPGNRLERRALARTVGPQNADQGSGRGLERQAADRLNRAVGAVDVLDAQDRGSAPRRVDRLFGSSAS